MNKNKESCFLVDPQSEGSLALYDYSLFSNVLFENKVFICNAKYDAPIIPNTTHYPIFNYLGKARFFKGLSYLVSLIKIMVLIFRYKPRVIHIQWFRLERIEYLFYNILRFIFKFKLVYTAHNIVPHNSGDKKLKTYKKLYDLANAVIVHSTNTKPELEAIGVDASKIFVIRHGILVNHSLDKKESFDFRKKYNIGNKLLFSISGVQSQYKGTDLLIEAWASTPQLYDNEECVLVIMGKNSGIDYSKVRNINNVIIIERFFTEEEQDALFKSTDVLLLPYRCISQSGVLLTALPYKIPLLVSNIGGLSETLNVANLGWTVDSDNITDLLNKLLYISRNPEEVRRIKYNNKEWDKILKYYSWETIGKETTSLYHAVCLKSR